MTTSSANLPISSVAIVGVGLIGGSFGLALRDSGFLGPVFGVSSQPALEAALRKGAITATASLEQAVSQADLVYLAQPVDRILQTLEDLGPRIFERIIDRPILLTDAGSTKQAIVELAGRKLPPNIFLGGHPMAGKEVSGADAADGQLFRGRPYVLTPTPGFNNPFLDSFRSVVMNSGAAPLLLSPEEHDAVVAMTSHLPQLLSTTLGLTLAVNPNPLFGVVHGAGLTDMTRLARGSAELWQSIVDTNRSKILDAIDKFAVQLSEMRKAVATGNISAQFLKAHTLCLQLRNANR